MEFLGKHSAGRAQCHRRSGTIPLDLVLDVEDDDGYFNVTLGNVLRDRAIRDTIRRVHLKSRDSKFLGSIISPLITKEPRSAGVESLILRDESGGLAVDISEFIAHHSFPKLQHLELFNCRVSSWDLIKLRAPVLTILDLYLRDPWPSSNPTTSQVLSILASYPTLQKVSLSWYEDPDDDDGDPSLRVSLPQLKELKLDGDAHDVFDLLDRLDHPGRMDRLDIAIKPCEIEDISQFIGPYLRAYLQHRGGSQSGLGLRLVFPYMNVIALDIGDAGGIDFHTPVPARVDPFITIYMKLDVMYGGDLLKEANLDLIAHTPRGDIVYFQTYNEHATMGEISAQLPNLWGLQFEDSPLGLAFPKPNLDEDGEIYPSLEYVLLDGLSTTDWSPLTTFLDRRASSGNRLHTLVATSCRIPPLVWSGLEDVVQELKEYKTSEFTIP